MRWGYKTVHFQLKKEGLLGNAFLDEVEVEESLNEFGQDGWELVSMLETDDGLIAIFKKPLEEPFEEFVEFSDKTTGEIHRRDDVITEDDIIRNVEAATYPEENEYNEDNEDERDSDEDGGLQSIRIE